MIIYKTTNLLNGKIYVGKDEKNNPNYLGSGKILKLAINKNGRDNFKKEILEVCDSREILNDREKYWIESLSATTLGYNITEGGSGGRTKFKKIYQYNKNGKFIKEWSSSAEIERLLGFDSSAILKVCKGKLLSTKGFIWSYYYNHEVDSYDDTKTVKTLQYDKNGYFIKEWNSIIEIKKNFNISDRHIQIVLDNPNKTAKGFIWIRKKTKIIDKIEVPKPKYFNNQNAKKNKT
jgi:group I intron endonuclease